MKHTIKGQGESLDLWGHEKTHLTQEGMIVESPDNEGEFLLSENTSWEDVELVLERLNQRGRR